LTEPGIEVLAELLGHAPQVKLLGTSRESLGLQDEWVFEVQGLPVPESIYAEGTVRDTSVELFLQRARRAHVEFNAMPEDYPAIVRICQLVNGNPLGIELAAAWVRTLSCDEIAREIERGLDILSLSARDVPARHRSMRAVFDHSWKLLTEEEQKVLMRLSVFRGGFRREAAEQASEATLAVLSTLVTKSLIRRSGAGRYDLHELIRQFAAEHFAERPDEQTATQARHGIYYLTYFSQADGRLRSSAQREALAELTVEMDNFRAAWDWGVARGEFVLIEQTARTLAMFYDTRGWLQEGLDTLGSAVSALEIAYQQSPPDRTNQVALGHILAFRSVLASRLRQYEQAQAMLERSLEILRPLDEPRVLVEAITFLGIDMELTSNYARALELYSDGLEMATSFGDRSFAGLCLTCVIDQIGIVQGMVKPEDTHERLQSAVADWRLIGDPRFTAFGLNLLSWSALALGRYAEARAALKESVSLSISVGDRWGLGFAYRGLGIVAQTQGEHSQAVDLFRKSLETLTELGARQDMARVLAEMGRSVFALGNDAEAGRVWREALRVAFETQGTFIALEALAGIASLQAKQSDMEHALELLLVVLNHPASLQETKDRASELQADLEAQLTPAQIEAIQAHAGEKTFEAVVEDLLK
jgi:predicted ATPase